MCKIADGIILLLLSMCSVSDLKKKTLPFLLLVAFSVTVAIFVLLDGAGNVRLRVGGAIIGILLLIVSKCTKESIGYGDSWIILLLGIYLGYLRILRVLFAASLFAGIVSVFFLWKCGWKKTATLPFVPFLSLSYLGVVIL